MSNFVQNYELLGLDEGATETFIVYPNPNNGTFTVEGARQLTVTNVVGQEVFAKHIEGRASVTLPRGWYFVRLNGLTKKVMVE